MKTSVVKSRWLKLLAWFIVCLATVNVLRMWIGVAERSPTNFTEWLIALLLIAFLGSALIAPRPERTTRQRGRHAR